MRREGGIGDGVTCQSTQAPYCSGNKFSKHEPVRPFKMQTIVYLIWLGNKNKATLTLMNPEAEFKASRKQLAKN